MNNPVRCYITQTMRQYRRRSAASSRANINVSSTAAALQHTDTWSRQKTSKLDETKHLPNFTSNKESKMQSSYIVLAKFLKHPRVATPRVCPRRRGVPTSMLYVSPVSTPAASSTWQIWAGSSWPPVTVTSWWCAEAAPPGRDSAGSCSSSTAGSPSAASAAASSCCCWLDRLCTSIGNGILYLSFTWPPADGEGRDRRSVGVPGSRRDSHHSEQRGQAFRGHRKQEQAQPWPTTNILPKGKTKDVPKGRADGARAPPLAVMDPRVLVSAASSQQSLRPKNRF